MLFKINNRTPFNCSTVIKELLKHIISFNDKKRLEAYYLVGMFRAFNIYEPLSELEYE